MVSANVVCVCEELEMDKRAYVPAGSSSFVRSMRACAWGRRARPARAAGERTLRHAGRAPPPPLHARPGPAGRPATQTVYGHACMWCVVAHASST